MSDSRRVASEVRTMRRRIWRFADCELDESRWRLTVREAAAQAQRNADLERQLLRARERRPWVVAAGAALTIGILTSSALYLEARHDRDAARRQSRIAEQINLFLANDLLARS